jgi:hypothetical protein
LTAVAPIRRCALWVVGSWEGNGRVANTLVQRWNGSSWRVVDSPQPGTWARLTDVVAVSPTRAWAVGVVNTGAVLETLILRWNGDAWKRQASPSPGVTDSRLEAIVATSATNAWAVGSYDVGGTYRTLVLHWDGQSWTRQPSGNTPSPTNQLYGVAASRSGAWAVGFANGAPPLVLRLRGDRWRVADVPNVTQSALTGVAVSGTSAWAVGSRLAGTDNETVILRWDGSAWRRVPSPNPGGILDVLEDVAVAGDGTAWAVGRTNDAGGIRSLILRWNGSSWTRVPSFEFPDDAESRLADVAVVSGSNVWAVGMHDAPVTRTFAVHCC